jgi:hypothetical protein
MHGHVPPDGLHDLRRRLPAHEPHIAVGDGHAGDDRAVLAGVLTGDELMVNVGCASRS